MTTPSAPSTSDAHNNDHEHRNFSDASFGHRQRYAPDGRWPNAAVSARESAITSLNGYSAGGGGGGDERRPSSSGPLQSNGVSRPQPPLDINTQLRRLLVDNADDDEDDEEAAAAAAKTPIAHSSSFPAGLGGSGAQQAPPLSSTPAQNASGQPAAFASSNSYLSSLSTAGGPHAAGGGGAHWQNSNGAANTPRVPLHHSMSLFGASASSASYADDP